MSHTRKPFQWDNYASSTAVSDDGCVGMRANVDGSGLEVSYDGAAWTAFSGAASSKWNGITNPDGNQSLTMAAHTTTWTWNATTGTNDLVTLTNTTDDTGTGVLFHIKTPGANFKTPFRVTAQTDRIVEVNASGNFTVTRYSDIAASLMGLVRGRNTAASPTAVQSGDSLGSLTFGGYFSSSAATTSATIRADAAANFTATNDAPADLIFATKSNTIGVHTALRITSDRWIGIGEDIAHADVLARLHVKTGTADLVGFRLDAPVSGTADIAAIYNQASTKVVYVSSTGTLFTTPTSGVAGINVGSFAGDPSSLGNGDIWYSTSANALRARVNGTTVSLSTSAPRLDEIANPAASKTFTMSAGGTDYPLIFSWDSTTGATNLFTLETAAGTGTGAMLLIKPLGGQEALVVNNGANQFVLGEGGEIDTNGLLTIRAASGLGIRLFDGATNNVYLQYVGATPALRVIYNGGPAESLVTEPGTQTLTNKTLSTATSVSVAIAWADGVTQTFNPNGTSAGINVGSHTADPSALNNGDLWYSTATNALRARINGATVSLGAGGSSVWSALTDPSGNLALTMAANTTAFTWNATTSTNDLFTLTNTSDDTGTGVLLHVKTPGTANAKTPFKITAQTDRSVEVNASGNVTVTRFTTGSGSLIGIVRGRGTAALPTAVQSTDSLGTVQFGGQYSSTIGQTTTSASIQADAVGNFTATNDAPADLILSTKSNTTGVRVGLRVTSDRFVGIGDEITHAQVTHGLTVLGTTKVVSNSINAIEVNSSGQVGFGHLDTANDFTFGFNGGRNDIAMMGALTTGLADAVRLSFQKSDSSTLGSPGDVEGDEFVASLSWQAYRQSAYREVAFMRAQTGSSFADGDYAGRFTWSVTKAGETSPAETLILLGGKLLVQGGASGANPTTTFEVHGLGSSTAVVDTLTIKDYQTSGTAAAGFGAAELWKLESNTTASQNAAQVETHWQDATHATRGAVHRIKTVANAGALLGRQILGCFKTIPDNTETALFSIVFGTTDHTAVNGYVQFTFIAKQVTGSVQTQTYHKVIPFSAYHNGSTNTGAAVWGTEALTAALTSTGGITFTGGSLGFKVNSTISPTPATGFNTATFQVQIDSDLTTISELSCYYNIFYTGQSEITLA